MLDKYFPCHISYLVSLRNSVTYNILRWELYLILSKFLELHILDIKRMTIKNISSHDFEEIY